MYTMILYASALAAPLGGIRAAKQPVSLRANENGPVYFVAYSEITGASEFEQTEINLVLDRSYQSTWDGAVRSNGIHYKRRTDQSSPASIIGY